MRPAASLTPPRAAAILSRAAAAADPSARSAEDHAHNSLAPGTEYYGGDRRVHHTRGHCGPESLNDPGRGPGQARLRSPGPGHDLPALPGLFPVRHRRLEETKPHRPRLCELVALQPAPGKKSGGAAADSGNGRAFPAGSRHAWHTRNARPET